MATKPKRKPVKKKAAKKPWNKCITGCGKDAVYMRRNRKTGDMEHYAADCFQRIVEESASFKKAVKMAEDYHKTRTVATAKPKRKKRAVKRVKK